MYVLEQGYSHSSECVFVKVVSMYFVWAHPAHILTNINQTTSDRLGTQEAVPVKTPREGLHVRQVQFPDPQHEPHRRPTPRPARSSVTRPLHQTPCPHPAYPHILHSAFLRLVPPDPLLPFTSFKLHALALPTLTFSKLLFFSSPKKKNRALRVRSPQVQYFVHLSANLLSAFLQREVLSQCSNTN